MLARLLPPAAVLLLLSACDQVREGAAPEYRPGEAGTVDHALCLLGFAAVPLRAVAPGHHLVEATINGQRGSFVLDTGANVTVVDEGVAERFGVSGGGAFGGLGGVSIPQGAGRARQATVDSFAVGEVEIRQDRVVVTSLGQLLGPLGQAAGVEVAGLIGQDVMGEHRAIIDVARPMLYLMAEDRAPAPVPAEQCAGEREAMAGG